MLNSLDDLFPKDMSQDTARSTFKVLYLM